MSQFKETLIREYQAANTNTPVDMQVISRLVREHEAQITENNKYYIVIEFKFPMERAMFTRSILNQDYTFFLDGDHYIQINK